MLEPGWSILLWWITSFVMGHKINKSDAAAWQQRRRRWMKRGTAETSFGLQVDGCNRGREHWNHAAAVSCIEQEFVIPKRLLRSVAVSTFNFAHDYVKRWIYIRYRFLFGAVIVALSCTWSRCNILVRNCARWHPTCRFFNLSCIKSNHLSYTNWQSSRKRGVDWELSALGSKAT